MERGLGSEECSHLTEECICSLEKILEYGWRNCQEDCRPDESFRAMIIVMKRWKEYLDGLERR